MLRIKTLKEQAELQNKILMERLDIILPQVMMQSVADAWIVASKEYNEDLVFPLLTPASYRNARRVTIFAFIKHEGRIKRFALSMPDEDLEKYYEQYWNWKEETQYDALNRLFKEYDVQNISLNTSSDTAFADGLSAGLYNSFKNEIDHMYVEKFMCDVLLPIQVMEIRTPTELELYPHVLEVAFSIIEKTFSNKSIIPGQTSCSDLEWLMKEEVNQLGLEYWFDPSIDLQRIGGSTRDSGVIQRGDLVHCDFGIKYMNICTDTQRNAYIAHPDEIDYPERIKEGFALNNKFQDIVRGQFKEGRSGNEVLSESLRLAKEQGITACLYSHPTNVYGHGPGTTIGLWNQQTSIPFAGELPLSYKTVFALELNISHDFTFYSEETVLFDEDGVHFLHPGRDHIYFIE